MAAQFWIIGFFVFLFLSILQMFLALVGHRKARFGLAEREFFFRSTTDLIAILDESLLVREVNRSARIKLRMDPAEVVGRPIEETPLWPETTREQRLAMRGLRSALDGEDSIFTFTMKQGSGIPMEIEIKAFPVQSPVSGRRELICYGRDVSVEFGTREKLKRRTEMEDIIARVMEASFAEGDARRRVPGILETAGDFLGARRAFLSQTDRSGTIVWEHLWSSPGTPVLVTEWVGKKVNDLIPFPINRSVTIARGMRDNPELPKDFREQASRIDLGSMVILTLAEQNGPVFGYAGFTFREDHPPEDGSAQILLKLLSVTLSGLLSRVDDQRDIKLFRQSVDAAGQGIALISEDGSINYSNGTYNELTGYLPEKDTPVWEHYTGGFSEKVRNLILPMVASGQRWNGELRIESPNGESIDTIESFVPVDTSAEEPVYIINMITDISDRKKLESQLIKARKEAEYANRAKSDYLANMSHEIRTPMNAVIGLAYLALQTDLNTRQKDYLTKINTAAKGLLNIINDILDLSKIEAGKLDLEEAPFSLDEVLESALDMTADTARNKGLKLLYYRYPEVPDTWIGDRFRLGQVLLNLLSNAVKFTSEGRIVLQVRNDVPGKLRFIVEDTGIGMTDEQVSRLFKPFQQAEISTSRQFGGTGLGLTISKQIVDLMHGGISVESSPGKGSRFEFTVALDRDRDAENSVLLPEPGSRGEAIVIAEDELTRDFHRGTLENLGYNVTPCSGVKEALENPNYPNLLLLDVDECCKDPRAALYALCSGAGEDFILIVTGGRTEEELMSFAPAGIRNLVLPMPYGKKRLNERLTELDFVGEDDVESLRNRGGTTISARILLADDNPINRQIGFELLASAGLEVDLAEDGKEASEMLEKGSYKLVFMDLHMPVMDGYEATRIIRSRYPELPVVAMTASPLSDVKTEILGAGFSGYIAKPIDPDQLFLTLSRELSLPESTLRAAADNHHGRRLQETPGSGGALPAEIEGINMEQGLRQTLGDHSKLKQLLEAFANQHISDAPVIGIGPKKDDDDRLISLLHSLRGSAGQIGALEIMKEAGHLEDSLRSGENIPNRRFINLAGELQALISRIHTDGGRPELDPGLLDHLEDRIRRSDDAAVDFLEHSIVPLADSDAYPFIERIRQSLSRWNYDEAMDAMDDWRVRLAGNREQ